MAPTLRMGQQLPWLGLKRNFRQDGSMKYTGKLSGACNAKSTKDLGTQKPRGDHDSGIGYGSRSIGQRNLRVNVLDHLHIVLKANAFIEVIDVVIRVQQVQ